jgi:hypothetical protein
MLPPRPKRWKFRDSVFAVFKQKLTIKAAGLEAYSDRALFLGCSSSSRNWMKCRENISSVVPKTGHLNPLT